MNWVDHTIWWHVYPLGFTGAFPAAEPPAPQEHRLRRVTAWLDHVVTLGASGIALGPVFASRTHGYDTTDHYQIDPRLGTGDDFDELTEQAHAKGLRVLLDGVFNHVGTEFGHYRRALDGDTDARRWFRESRGGFATFEGHGDLIALNHDEPEVVDYVVDVMGTGWTAAPTGGDWTRPIRCPPTSGLECCLAFARTTRGHGSSERCCTATTPRSRPPPATASAAHARCRRCGWERAQGGGGRGVGRLAGMLEGEGLGYAQTLHAQAREQAGLGRAVAGPHRGLVVGTLHASSVAQASSSSG